MATTETKSEIEQLINSQIVVIKKLQDMNTRTGSRNDETQTAIASLKALIEALQLLD